MRTPKFPGVGLSNSNKKLSIFGNSSALSQIAMYFIDIGANLTDESYAGIYNGQQRHEPDIGAVLMRAREAGIMRTIVTAGTLQQSYEAVALASTDPNLYSTCGIHPTRASEMLDDSSTQIKLLSGVVHSGRGKVVAVGECGLDYDRTQFCSEADQMPAFLAQFSLAEETGLPMFLHDRNTRGDFAEVIRKNRSRFSGGVVHSFTGTLEEMQEYVRLGLHIGLNGCSLKTNANLDIVRAVPLERLMLETDCPYCEIRPSHAGFQHVKSKWQAKDKKKYSPDALVKGRSEPCQILQVCEVIAAARGVSEETIARAAFNNSMMLFFPKEAADMGTSPYDLCMSAVPSPAP